MGVDGFGPGTAASRLASLRFESFDGGGGGLYLLDSEDRSDEFEAGVFRSYASRADAGEGRVRVGAIPRTRQEDGRAGRERSRGSRNLWSAAQGPPPRDLRARARRGGRKEFRLPTGGSGAAWVPKVTSRLTRYGRTVHSPPVATAHSRFLPYRAGPRPRLSRKRRRAAASNLRTWASRPQPPPNKVDGRPRTSPPSGTLSGKGGVFILGVRTTILIS